MDLFTKNGTQRLNKFIVQVMNSLQFMIRLRRIYHENPKVGKHEKSLSYISCFRD